MSHDYKQEIRDWFMDDRLGESITQDSLFIALDADPEYWERRRAFDRAIQEMIAAGEFDTYAGELQFNAMRAEPPFDPENDTRNVVMPPAPYRDQED